MLIIDRLTFAAAFFALGWFGHTVRERRNQPRKRSKAIPAGTSKDRKPGRPKKAAPATGEPLPME